MIGNADHLLHRLVVAVEQWLNEHPIARQKTA